MTISFQNKESLANPPPRPRPAKGHTVKLAEAELGTLDLEAQRNTLGEPNVAVFVPFAAVKVFPAHVRVKLTSTMSHDSVWYSRPRKFGKGSRQW